MPLSDHLYRLLDTPFVFLAAYINVFDMLPRVLTGMVLSSQVTCQSRMFAHQARPDTPAYGSQETHNASPPTPTCPQHGGVDCTTASYITECVFHSVYSAAVVWLAYLLCQWMVRYLKRYEEHVERKAKFEGFQKLMDLLFVNNQDLTSRWNCTLGLLSAAGLCTCEQCQSVYKNYLIPEWAMLLAHIIILCLVVGVCFVLGMTSWIWWAATAPFHLGFSLLARLPFATGYIQSRSWLLLLSAIGAVGSHHYAKEAGNSLRRRAVKATAYRAIAGSAHIHGPAAQHNLQCSWELLRTAGVCTCPSCQSDHLRKAAEKPWRHWLPSSRSVAAILAALAVACAYGASFLPQVQQLLCNPQAMSRFEAMQWVEAGVYFVVCVVLGGFVGTRWLRSSWHWRHELSHWRQDLAGEQEVMLHALRTFATGGAKWALYSEQLVTDALHTDKARGGLRWWLRGARATLHYALPACWAGLCMALAIAVAMDHGGMPRPWDCHRDGGDHSLAAAVQGSCHRDTGRPIPPLGHAYETAGASWDANRRWAPESLLGNSVLSTRPPERRDSSSEETVHTSATAAGSVAAGHKAGVRQAASGHIKPNEAGAAAGASKPRGKQGVGASSSRDAAHHSSNRRLSEEVRRALLVDLYGQNDEIFATGQHLDIAVATHERPDWQRPVQFLAAGLGILAAFVLMGQWLEEAAARKRAAKLTARLRATIAATSTLPAPGAEPEAAPSSAAAEVSESAAEITTSKSKSSAPARPPHSRSNKSKAAAKVLGAARQARREGGVAADASRDGEDALGRLSAASSLGAQLAEPRSNKCSTGRGSVEVERARRSSSGWADLSAAAAESIAAAAVPSQPIAPQPRLTLLGTFCHALLWPLRQCVSSIAAVCVSAAMALLGPAMSLLRHVRACMAVLTASSRRPSDDAVQQQPPPAGTVAASAQVKPDATPFMPLPHNNLAQQKLSADHALLKAADALSPARTATETPQRDTPAIPNASAELPLPGGRIPPCQTHVSSGRAGSNMLEDETLCVVCMSNTREVAFQHGRKAHFCVCRPCAALFNPGDPCPICRDPIADVLDIY